MVKDVILEIGTEELPAEFISIGLEQLKRLTDFHLQKERIKFQKIETFATPRRLILWIGNVEDKQISKIKEVRGPAEEIAFDIKKRPKPQAIGFARAQGMRVTDLVIKEQDKKNYVFAVHKTKAEPAKKVLKRCLPQIIRNLAFPKMMRWNNSGISFARPILWILSIMGKEIIKFEIGGVKSSNLSFGHSYLNPKSFRVKDVSGFKDELKSRHCLIDPKERIGIIEVGGNLLAKRAGGRVYAGEKILEEISNLIEYPLCLLGKFSSKYLKIPGEILTEVIRVQEKCLPIKNNSGKLLPFFLIVANRKQDRGGVIKKGYEKVMDARFKDAWFFYREDLKIPLLKKKEFLKGIIFHEKLGTLFDKVDRLKKTAEFFNINLNLTPAELDDYKRAGQLCKTDLLTEIVKEFPALQGYMGRHYAEIAGENQIVSEAIFGHYLPRFTGDDLPRTKTGALLGISDRIDTLTGYFHIGLLPSGSEDPYSLRRQANGLVEIILKFAFPIDLGELIDESLKIYGFSKTKELKTVLLNFLRSRLSFALKQKGYQIDFIEAVLTAGYLKIPDAMRKLEALRKFSCDKDYPQFLKTYQRLNNILKNFRMDGNSGKVIEESLIKERAERSLYQSYLAIKEKIKRCDALSEVYKALCRFIPLINDFFAEVMVMVPDENLRFNRLFLLSKIRELFLNLADFSLVKQNN